MSRIGRNPVKVPEGVNIAVAGQRLTAKGKFGELSLSLSNEVAVRHEKAAIVVEPRTDTILARKMWGTARSLVNNLVNGVSKGYTRNLEIQGTGYRAQVQGKTLILQLGFSHDVKYPIPNGITVKCADQTHIQLQGADRHLVGQTAAEIRGFRPPEPYKGKGIRYENEYVRRKEGKKK